MANLSDPGAGCSTKCEQVTDAISEDGRVNDANGTNQSVSVFGDRNPMLNPVVLNELFKVCDLSDLFNFRLVSKEWYSVSLTRFRGEMTVVIDEFTDVIKKSGSYNLVNRQLSEWHRLDASANKPFKSFRMKYVQLGLWSEKEPNSNLTKMYKNMDQFWGKFGRWIRKLELWHSRVHCANRFRKAISEETPNLEELHLIEIENESGGDPVSCEGEESVEVQPNLKYLVVNTIIASLPVTWKLLFRLFPNIHNVELTPIFNDHGIQDLSRVLTEISTHLKVKIRPKFTIPKLLLHLRCVAEMISVIELLQIPLITMSDITLNFRSFTERWNEGMQHFNDIFSTAFLQHGHTLEAFRVIAFSKTSRTDNFPLHPGPFISLTKLDLIGNFCQNFHFLEHFPNLKFLGLLGCDMKIFQNTNSARMEKIHLDHLKDFRFDVGKEEESCLLGFHIPESGMEMLAKLMPQVEVFQGKLSNSSLRVLCRGWRQLRDLRIESLVNFKNKLSLDDEGITGIVKGCEERMSNITDLKDLKYLSIPNGENISDLSVYDGFLKMPQLQTLSVELSEEASEDAFNALNQRFPQGWISRRHVDN